MSRATGWCLLVVASTLACHDKNRSAATASSSGPRGPDSAHRDEPTHEPLPKRVRVTPSVIADAKIATQAASVRRLAITLALPGEIAADPDRSARVASPVAGRIERVDFREGSVVKKGDTLAVVRIPELGKVRGAHVATAAKAKAARANAGRLAALSEKGLAAKQEAATASAEAEALAAETRALAEQLAALDLGAGSGSLLPLRAPLSGTVIARDAIVGQPISAEHVIATVADMDQLWFLGKVFERELSKLFEGSHADVELNAYPDQHFPGVVEYIGRQVDPTARTVVARIRLAKRDDRLRIGLFGTGRAETGEQRAPVLCVPRSALTEIGGKPAVFVKQPDGDFEVHELVLGEHAVGQIEVLSGLRVGELVVVDGVITLKTILLKASLAEED